MEQSEVREEKAFKRSANPAIAIIAKWMMRYKNNQPSFISGGAEIRLQLYKMSPIALYDVEWTMIVSFIS